MLSNKEAMARLYEILTMQRARVAPMSTQKEFVQYDKLDKLIIGVCGGDGIGPVITKVSEGVLRALLKEEVACMFEERKLVVTGRDNGATSEVFGQYVMETTHSLP